MDFRIRAAIPKDAGPMARVHVDSWRTSYAGIVPDDHLAQLSYRGRELTWVDILSGDHGNFVAETDTGEVVGFAGGGPERDGDPVYCGELYGLYLLREFQRRGIGRSLVSVVAERLLTDGFSSMLLWVLEDNHPARRFYGSLGGKPVGCKTVTIGGANLVELAYGWRDITSLAAESGYGQEV